MLEEHACENAGCDRPAPFGVICYACVDHCDELINAFDEHDLFGLYDIALRNSRPAIRNMRTTGGGQAIQDALDLFAYTLWQQLSTQWPDMLPRLAQRADAVAQYRRIVTGCDVARRLLEGENSQAVSDEHIAEQMSRIQPMKAKDASAWLWANMRVRVSPDRIRRWVADGRLLPRRTEGRGAGARGEAGATGLGRGAHYYHPVDILKALEQSRENKPSRQLL